MTRTSKYRILYYLTFIITLLVLISMLWGMAQAFPDSAAGLVLATFVVGLIPGRIQRKLWVDYFEGQQFQSKGKHLEALQHFEKFVKAIRKTPGLKRWIWLSNWIYTQDVEVMALNNMGVSYLWLNKYDKAEETLQKAHELDPGSPLPYYNLSVTHFARGDQKNAVEYMEKARQQGYRRSSIKKLEEMANTPPDPAGQKSG
jgi:tetratricopeptide (TPR) repeat protein